MAVPLRRVFWRLVCLWLCGCSIVGSAWADTVNFTLPAQPADAALLAFSQQAKVEVLFSFDALHQVQSSSLNGRYEPEEALQRLLHGTGFVARRSGRQKFVVTPLAPATGSLEGRLLISEEEPAVDIRVSIPDTGQTTLTNRQGEFAFERLPPGSCQLVVNGEGYQPLHITEAEVRANQRTVLETQRLHAAQGLAQLEPFVVRDKSGRNGLFEREAKLLPPRTAVGNLDLRRTEDDVLAYTVYDRRQLVRSGVVNLNEFLQRELLDSDAATRPPEQDGGRDSFISSSTNLSLRGYGTEETVILVNGRRLPEILYSGATPQLPDVNFIPLSLVQQVEVLPVSASALYTGNAVGGVINIVLRPDVDASASEVTLTYTNALSGYDAPQSSVSLLHAQTLLGGKLRVRVNASVTSTMPPVEAELRYHQNRDTPPELISEPVHRATPNIRSVSLEPLFGEGTSPLTSVPPGAKETPNLADFAERQGHPNLTFFDSPGALAPSLDSIDYPYGRKQQRNTYFGSVVYDLASWLQVGVDGTYSQTVANRGYDVLVGDLRLKASSAFNPFAQDVYVALNETAPLLGQNYSEARLDFTSLVVGMLIKLPCDWRLSLDTQYAHNMTRYRGLAGADPVRWQRLVDEGRYNPLRDTQVYGPPAAFYDDVLIYRGARGRFSTLGNYDTVDAALRATNESLVLPTGQAVLNAGVDYRLSHLAAFNDHRRYSDGTLAFEPIQWSGRTLQRYSAFGELQAPLVPKKWLPSWLRTAETDLAARYVAANSSKESNIAPTFGLKVELAGGLSFRGSLTTSNRLPTPYMSRQVMSPTGTPGGIDLTSVLDPVRKERYLVQAADLPNPDLRTESALTQTAGAIFQRGRVHRVRASIDFVDTQQNQRTDRAQSSNRAQPRAALDLSGGA